MHCPFFVNGIIALLVPLFLLPVSNQSAAQDAPNIVVAEMSYLYKGLVYKDSAMLASNPFQQAASRIVYALNDTIANRMTASLLQAMNNRWGCNLKDIILKVDKAENLLGTVPKFKPKVKKPDAGLQYVFMRIVDYGASTDCFFCMNV